MKKILTKGLTVAMVVAIMASGMAYADTTTEEKIIPADRLEQMKEKFDDKFDGNFKVRVGEGMEKMKEMRDLSPEERLAELEAKLDDADLTDEMKERIENAIEKQEERIAFDAELDALLEGKTDEEKVAALEDLLDEGDYDERQTARLERMIEKYEIGEDTFEEIRTALQEAERGEKKQAVEDLIDSGDYDGAALDHLNNMLDHIEEGEAIKAEMEALREEFKDLTKEERQAKIQEMIDSGDYDETVTERLTKMLERKDQMGDKIREKVGEFKANGGPRNKEEQPAN